MMTRWCAIGTVGVLAAAAACSGEDGEGNGGGGEGATGTEGSGGSNVFFGNGGSGMASGGAPVSGGSGAGNGGGVSFGGDTSTPPTINACEPQADEEGCVGERYEGESTPLDIYVMFDQSCSMSCPAESGGPGQCCMGGPNPRIDHVRSAMDQFLRDPRSAGIGVGIGYFGYMQGGRTSCDPSDYSEPDVRMGLLPAYADTLTRSLNRADPTGETPTGAAIRGACTYAAQWQTLHPSHSTVVLLVTDGVPEAPTTSQNGGCTPTIEDAVQAATTCAGHDPTLPIYVLGVGQALQNLNQIAEAGGTERAYLVEGGDVSSQVLAALNAIRADAAIPCELSLPEPPMGETLNLAEVNVGFCDAQGANQTLLYVETEDRCDPSQGGWYLDDASEKVMLCGRTCEQVTIPGGSLFMSVGCSRRGFIQ
jgi:hypothetical protein